MQNDRMGRTRLGVVASLIVGPAAVCVVGCATTAALAQAPGAFRAEMNSSGDDAVILDWEQRWTLDREGAVHRRNHYRVRLFNSRPIRRFGDPRIAYDGGQEKLIFHEAQAILPDGTVLPVPEYSFNEVGPDDVAGWPEYARWREAVVSFSGIEPGVILELNYEIVTPPGVLPWIDADIRLDDEYPVDSRTVSIEVPTGVTVRHQLDHAPGVIATQTQGQADGRATTTYRWVAKMMAGDRGERQSRSWRQRSPRLRFSTCPDSATWASRIVDRVDQSATPDDTVKRFALAVVAEERDAGERVRKLAEKVKASFNFVTSTRATRGLDCRNAKDVLNANYGNALESATLLVSAYRSLGLTARPVVGVDAVAWNASDAVAPTASAFSAVLVRVDLLDGAVFVHPQRGVVENPGAWGRHRLLDGDGTETYLFARGEQGVSDLSVVGKIAIDEGGEATGELRIRLTGAFYDPAALKTTAAQGSLIKSLVGRVLSDFDVASHSVVTLSDDEFRATANVRSAGALRKYGEERVVRFGDGPAFLNDFHLPLEREQRKTDVFVGGQIRERINLSVELPKAWRASIVPASFPTIDGKWGRVSQDVTRDGQTLRFAWGVTVASETLSSGAFAELRNAINALRMPRHLILACGE